MKVRSDPEVHTSLPDRVGAIHWLRDDETFTDAEELGMLGKVFNQDLFNMAKLQLGLETTRKPGITLGNYQASKVRWLSHDSPIEIEAFVDTFLCGYDAWGPHQRVTSPDERMLALDDIDEDEWPDELLTSGVWTIFPHTSIAGFNLLAQVEVVFQR